MKANRYGKIYEAKWWRNMTIDERKNASPCGCVTYLWDDECLFLKSDPDENGCEWEYVFACEVVILEEDGGNE